MAPDPDLPERIRELIGGTAGVTEKQMFGGIAFLLHGNMAVTASGRGGLMVRVDPTESAALQARNNLNQLLIDDGRIRLEAVAYDAGTISART